MDQAERITLEIKRINDEREYEAAKQTRTVIDSIITQQKIIADAQKRIADLKAQLHSISYTPVNAADIV